MLLLLLLCVFVRACVRAYVCVRACVRVCSDMNKDRPTFYVSAVEIVQYHSVCCSGNDSDKLQCGDDA